jgi:molecular chaperone DnaJ
MGVKDYYRILGVEKNADSEDVKKAYRRMAKNYHPDTKPAGDSETAQEKFKDITEAYEVLNDPDRRKKYDQMNRINWGASGSYQPIDLDGEEEKEYDETVQEEISEPAKQEKAKKTEEPLSDQTSNESPNGRVIEIVVSFETAVRGGRQLVTISLEEDCFKCKGTGARSKKDLAICRGCEGTGIINGAGSPGEEKCPRCKGKGKLIKNRCTRCQGSGSSRKDRKIAVKIPPGVDDGARIMLSELVEPENQAIATGMQMVFKISKHPYFHREGINVICDAPIDLRQAILGGKISVRTAMGKRLSITIPPGTDSGTTFRIKDEGITKDGKRGHQLVKVNIITPKRLSDKAKEYLDLFLREVQSKLR